MSEKKDLKRMLTMLLGGFWLLDGILQFQPQMFTNAFVNAVLSPNIQNQPKFIANTILFGIHIFSINLFWSNLISALIQILIGILLMFPLRENARRFGLWLSIFWALIVWIFGEGLGNIATGSATFYTGAPGSAFLYLIIALSLVYSFYKKLPRLAGILFILCALLNLTPMFWQPTMLSMVAMVPAVSGALGAIGSQGTLIGNFIAVDLLVFLGIFLILMPNRPVAWITMIFLLIVWSIGQYFGGLSTFPFGTATDPNSTPIFALFLIPIFFNEGTETPGAPRQA